MSLLRNAQMYVSPNSYMFVNDAYVYVGQDINMNGDGALYLRKQGQLLQATAGASSNQGTGILSVFQEGTSNNYGYNYWCSPVSFNDVAIGNTGFFSTQLNRPTSVTTASPATITSYSTLDGSTTNTSLSIAGRWIWKYVASNQYNLGGPNGWQYVGNIGSVETGLGFTMKGVSGLDTTTAHPVSGNLGDGISNNPGNNQRYDFRGRPNDGTISIAVDNSSGMYSNKTLTGNPYPSAINLNLFLLENSGYTVNYSTGSYSFSGSPVINGNAYFWEHRKTAASHVLVTYEGGYGTYAPNGPTAFDPGTYTAATWNTYNADGSLNTTGATSGGVYERMFTPVGQGFMIQGFTLGSATMKNLYRTFVKEGLASYSQFERSTQNATVGNENWEEIPNVANVDYTQFSKKQVPQFKIHTVMNDQNTRETAVAFNDNATDGFDFALDAISPEANLPRDSFFPIDGDKKFVINTLPFGIDKKIPVAFKADIPTKFNVSVKELINFDASQAIFMHDKLTNEYFDIKNSYFEITLPIGLTTTRFEITFKNETIILSTPSEVAGAFQVYQNNELEMLTIFNSLQKDITSLTLFDVSGKIMLNKSNLGTSEKYEISTSVLNTGVYVVKLITAENETIDKKIIIDKR